MSLHDAVYAAGAAAIALPPPPPRVNLEAAVASALERVDGLLLQGGGDVQLGAVERSSPSPIGDAADRRDAFELGLLEGAIAAGLPVLGICRGMQLINIAMGGSLHAEVERADLHGARHADPSRYDRHRHAIELLPDGRLRSLYGRSRGVVSSAHRQGVATLGVGLRAEARCPEDDLVEALRGTRGYLIGVQWHPEFLDGEPPELEGGLLFRDFVRAAAER